MNTQITQFLLATIFLTTVFLNIAKKNFDAALLYAVQSLAIVLILIVSFFETGAVSLLFIATLVFAVKVLLAPGFLYRLIKKHDFKFSASTYVNTPLTLIIVAALTAAAYSQKLAPLTSIIPANRENLALALSAIFISLFLAVNRKGAISQIIGILSLENSIVAFAIFSKLEQSLGLQFGVIFDMFLWLIIAIVFVSMIYRHFGSLDVTSMEHLKD